MCRALRRRHNGWLEENLPSSKGKTASGSSEISVGEEGQPTTSWWGESGGEACPSPRASLRGFRRDGSKFSRLRLTLRLLANPWMSTGTHGVSPGHGGKSTGSALGGRQGWGGTKLNKSVSRSVGGRSYEAGGAWPHTEHRSRPESHLHMAASHGLGTKQATHWGAGDCARQAGQGTVLTRRGTPGE